MAGEGMRQVAPGLFWRHGATVFGACKSDCRHLHARLPLQILPPGTDVPGPWMRKQPWVAASLATAPDGRVRVQLGGGVDFLPKR
eukprot:4302598-Prymnesium_polylepis.1